MVIKIANILLVEDDESAATLIEQFMEQLSSGHRLTIFSNAAQALAWGKTHQIDLFILDIQLPDYRGTELGKQLRSMPEYRFTPILFTTELSGEELSAYREIKCYDFLVKPFNEQQFHEAVTAALEMGENLTKPPAILRIEQKQFVFEYDLKTVLYIESFGKRAVIHTTVDGEIVSDSISSYSLARLLDLAGPGHLLQCHKSFLVNPLRISKLDKRASQLWLTGCDTAIPIGERYRHNLRKWRTE